MLNIYGRDVKRFLLGKGNLTIKPFNYEELQRISASEEEQEKNEAPIEYDLDIEKIKAMSKKDRDKLFSKIYQKELNSNLPNISTRLRILENIQHLCNE